MQGTDNESDSPGSFRDALGVALVPDAATHRRVLAVTDAAFRCLRPADGSRVDDSRSPHVSVFQNMFRGTDDLSDIVETALSRNPLRRTFAVRAPPDDVCVWAGDRLFISLESDPNLDSFHDSLLAACISGDGRRVCSGRPADPRPITGVTPEQERAYRETGYVFAGAGTRIARERNLPWRAFTLPHFTIGVADWESRPGHESIDEARRGAVRRMRDASKVVGLARCRFDKVVIFRVGDGGVYSARDGGTIREFSL